MERAALAGERAARGLAAQDVRTLVSRDGGLTLQPYAARFEDRPKNLLAYVGVKHLGYWCESFVAPDAPAPLQAVCEASLDALIDAMRPGAAAAQAAATAERALGGRSPHPVLSGRFGRRIGLSLDEGDAIRADSSVTIKPNVAYALHAGAVENGAGCVSSAVVVVRERGCETLFRSASAS